MPGTHHRPVVLIWTHTDYWLQSPFTVFVCLPDGREAADEDSSESEAEETGMNQECKTQAPNSQPGSGSHRPKPPRTSLEDSGRWSDTLSVDEKDGFVFVNYSEGQARPANPPTNTHSSSQSMPQPLQPNNTEPRPYSNLRAGMNMHFTFIKGYSCIFPRIQCDNHGKELNMFNSTEGKKKTQ